MPTVLYRPRKKHAQNNHNSNNILVNRVEKLIERVNMLLKRM